MMLPQEMILQNMSELIQQQQQQQQQQKQQHGSIPTTTTALMWQSIQLCPYQESSLCSVLQQCQFADKMQQQQLAQGRLKGKRKGKGKGKDVSKSKGTFHSR